MNENRIRIMTALAAYEKHHNKELDSTGSWFRGDYIGVHLLKNGCRFTFAYLIGLSFYVLLYFEKIMDQLNSMDIKGLLTPVLTVYVILLLVYLGFTYLVYAIGYYQAEKKRRTFSRLVDRLELEYKQENRIPARRRRREGQDGRR